MNTQNREKMTDEQKVLVETNFYTILESLENIGVMVGTYYDHIIDSIIECAKDYTENPLISIINPFKEYAVTCTVNILRPIVRHDMKLAKEKEEKQSHYKTRKSIYHTACNQDFTEYIESDYDLTLAISRYYNFTGMEKNVIPNAMINNVLAVALLSDMSGVPIEDIQRFYNINK